MRKRAAGAAGLSRRRKEPRRSGHAESRWMVRTGGLRGVLPLSQQPARSRKGGALYRAVKRPKAPAFP